MDIAPRVQATILESLSTHGCRPDRIAFEFLHDGDRRDAWTYEQLNRRVRSLAAVIEAGARPGDRALLTYGAGLEFVAAFLACLRVGVIAVPAPAVGRRRQSHRLKAIIDDAQPALILTGEDSAASWHPDLLPSSGACAVIATDTIASADGEPRASHPSPDAVAYLQYTSGSTSAPKGVMITHRNIVANCWMVCNAFGFSGDSVVASWLPLFHDMGLLGNVLVPLYGGFLSVMMAPKTFIRSPLRWLQAITTYKATCAGGPDFGWDYCVRMISDDDKRGLDLGSLVTAFNGSEPVRLETLARFSEAFAAQGFRPEAFFPCYGMAEATLFISGGPHGRLSPIARIDREALEAGRFVEAPGGDRRAVVSCGRLWDDTCVRIVRPDTATACVPGEVGEIWVSSGSVGAGYWNKPDLTRETFGARLATGEGPFLRTGDLGCLRDGELFVTGRRKDMLIVRGRNIYPQDVEATTERASTFIKANSCAIFALDTDGREGVALVAEADRRLARKLAALSASPIDSDAAGAVRAEVADAIAAMRRAVAEEHEVLLDPIVFVQPGTFPRTSSGKVQRAVCRSRWLAGDLEVLHVSPSSSDGLVAAQEVAAGTKGLVESVIRDWARAERGEHALEIDDTTPLLSLGIDSLGAVTIAAELERRSGKRVNPDAIYEYRTVAELARYLDRHAVPTDREGERPSCRRTSRQQIAERMSHFNQRIDRWKQQERYFFHTEISEQSGPWVRAGGRTMLMLGSYSYLGLIDHPAVADAAVTAMARYGTGPHGTRILAGSTSLHRELEEALADFMKAEDALVFSSGYVCNLATISTLVGEGDWVIGDEWNHASLVDGCRLSGATFRQFRHNDMASLEQLLIDANGRHTLVVTDSVFSMDGDIIDLAAVVALCRRYGALLMVDEAHSLGVLGRTGHGIIEHTGLAPAGVDIKMGTLSKAIPSIGGFVAGDRDLIGYLKHQARGFVFSGALPVGQVAAALAALRVIEREPERVSRLWAVTRQYLTGLRALGFDVYRSQTPIVPIACPTEEAALRMTKICREKGLFVLPVFYPAVPMNSPRLRTCVSAAHTSKDIDFALEVLAYAGRKAGVLSGPASRPVSVARRPIDSYALIS